MDFDPPQLKNLPVSERENALPAHLKFIVQASKKNSKVHKIYLFGSQARGDARPNSDFDIAFDLKDASLWEAFKLNLEEAVPSLYTYDFVNLDEIAENFRKKVLFEGILIYER